MHFTCSTKRFGSFGYFGRRLVPIGVDSRQDVLAKVADPTTGSSSGTLGLLPPRLGDEVS
jgi:hypothetical protein